MWPFPIPVHKWPLYNDAVEMWWGRRLCWWQWWKELWWVKSLAVSLATSHQDLRILLKSNDVVLVSTNVIETLKIESTPYTCFEPESKNSVLPGLEEYNWMLDIGLSIWVQNVDCKVEFLLNGRTWFLFDQANVWYRKLGDGRRGPEVEIGKRLLRTDFLF